MLYQLIDIPAYNVDKMRMSTVVNLLHSVLHEDIPCTQGSLSFIEMLYGEELLSCCVHLLSSTGRVFENCIIDGFDHPCLLQEAMLYCDLFGLLLSSF